jgi:hypothetical protein
MKVFFHKKKEEEEEAWHIGPVSLCNRNDEEKDRKVKLPDIDNMRA